MADLNFKIEGVSKTAARFEANARHFKLVIDEPPGLGGDDQGANPVEFLLASYAGCINVVAHLTAKELGIKVDRLKIAVNGNINPARLFGHPDGERAGFKNIEVEFSPETDATPELTERWIKAIKYRCPINDNLTAVTPVSFNLIKQSILV